MKRKREKEAGDKAPQERRAEGEWRESHTHSGREGDREETLKTRPPPHARTDRHTHTSSRHLEDADAHTHLPVTKDRNTQWERDRGCDLGLAAS